MLAVLRESIPENCPSRMLLHRLGITRPDQIVCAEAIKAESSVAELPFLAKQNLMAIVAACSQSQKASLPAGLTNNLANLGAH